MLRKGGLGFLRKRFPRHKTSKGPSAGEKQRFQHFPSARLPAMLGRHFFAGLRMRSDHRHVDVLSNELKASLEKSAAYATCKPWEKGGRRAQIPVAMGQKESAAFFGWLTFIRIPSQKKETSWHHWATGRVTHGQRGAPAQRLLRQRAAGSAQYLGAGLFLGINRPSNPFSLMLKPLIFLRTH